ncbi:MAG TPA: glycosyltransferase family 1 protein [Methylomirabilota bacterium]|nr:glycosyltransferase family 1 protein [Methylomirabilota bacterium]
MKIGITTSVAQRGKTGIAQYLFGLLRALRAEATRHEFVLFVLREDRPLFQFASDCMQILEVDEKFRPPVRDILWHQTALPLLARKHGLDIIHVPSYRRLIGVAPCARVATIHDLAPFRVSRKYDPARMLYGKLVVKRLAHRQDEIITVSQNTAADLQKFFGVDPSRVTVVHNGLDHERFHPNDRAASRERVSEKHSIIKPFFLYVARLEHPAKNHVRLIHAFNAFKKASGSEWQLVIGGSDWHGAEAIHEAAGTSPYARDIRMLGFVADADLPDLYRAADAFVYPSLYEGFGLPPVEAMACGTPVVCSSRGALAEVVDNAACIIDPESEQSIQQGLEMIACNEERKKALVAAGLRQARKFSWDTAAQATLNVYSRALSISNSRAKARTLVNQAQPPVKQVNS